MRSKEELQQLAQDILSGAVFACQDEGGAQIAFGMVLACMTPEICEELAAKEPQVFYEYVEKALPHTVNDYPQFSSMHWIDKEEWQVFYPIYDEMRNKVLGAVS